MYVCVYIYIYIYNHNYNYKSGLAQSRAASRVASAGSGLAATGSSTKARVSGRRCLGRARMFAARLRAAARSGKY